MPQIHEGFFPTNAKFQALQTACVNVAERSNSKSACSVVLIYQKSNGPRLSIWMTTMANRKGWMSPKSHVYLLKYGKGVRLIIFKSLEQHSYKTRSGRIEQFDSYVGYKNELIFY
jgi:hypothetical protein